MITESYESPVELLASRIHSVTHFLPASPLHARANALTLRSGRIGTGKYCKKPPHLHAGASYLRPTPQGFRQVLPAGRTHNVETDSHEGTCGIRPRATPQVPDVSTPHYRTHMRGGGLLMPSAGGPLRGRYSTTGHAHMPSPSTPALAREAHVTKALAFQRSLQKKTTGRDFARGDKPPSGAHNHTAYDHTVLHQAQECSVNRPAMALHRL